jgi:hypothetical protein
MPLQKEIEFPLFHLGTETSSNGKKVEFTPAVLREMERNSNFVAQAGILTAPIKYDHPAFGARDKDNHGRLARYEVRGNSLFAVGTDWSDRIVADKRDGKKIAYSAEFFDEFEFTDPTTGKRVKLGPTVCGLAILGADRPAIKNLKPFSTFEFAEGVHVVDAYETRQELQKAGLVAETVEGTHFFGEVENDSRRFAERDEETAMTSDELLKIGEMLQTKLDAAVAPIKADIAGVKASVNQFSEQGKRDTEAHAFCEELKTKREKTGPLPPAAVARLKDALTDPETTPGVAAKIRVFAESIPALFVERGTSENEATGDDAAAKAMPNVAKLKIRTFSESERRDVGNQNLIADSIDELRAAKPELFKEAKTMEQEIAVVQQYVAKRDGASA